MRVCTPITIRYAETDMMGVVYHANYLLYFEDARTAFLEAIGYPYARIEEAGGALRDEFRKLRYDKPNK